MTPQQRYAAKVSGRKIGELLARLGVVYGTPWGRDDVGKALLAEWHRVLAHLPQECVVAAVERYIASPATRAPVPGQIIALAQEDVAWLRRQIELDAAGRAAARSRAEPVEVPWTPPTEIERASVAGALAKWKSAFGEDRVGQDRVDQWAPASQDMTVSNDLRHSCVARRARHEPTCEYDCQRLRDSANCRYRAQRCADDPA